MSRHSSLKSSGKIKVKRNVLKRYERIDILKKTGKLKDGDSPFGLPKTKPEA
ncbi:MAG TPA: small basic protein [Victivallales bacterium]|nr:small basic protein [Victivallales bacterium]HRR05723.1 small basic protein [Victivallales bacterium]HRR29617.1 small basic protein [Victivallales bacterium]